MPDTPITFELVTDAGLRVTIESAAVSS